jgi:hypothetical protein
MAPLHLRVAARADLGVRARAHDPRLELAPATMVVPGRRGRGVRQRPAKPRTAVRIRSAPPQLRVTGEPAPSTRRQWSPIPRPSRNQIASTRSSACSPGAATTSAPPGSVWLQQVPGAAGIPQPPFGYLRIGTSAGPKRSVRQAAYLWNGTRAKGENLLWQQLCGRRAGERAGARRGPQGDRRDAASDPRRRDRQGEHDPQGHGRRDRIEEPVSLDMTKARARLADWVTFNGYANQYVTHPLKPGETTRFWVVAAGATNNINFPVVGTMFDRAWVNSDLASPPQKDIQTVGRAGRRRCSLRRQDPGQGPVSLRQPRVCGRRPRPGGAAQGRQSDGVDEPLDPRWPNVGGFDGLP